jgi:methyltransferase
VIDWSDTRLAYTALVGLVAAMRLIELAVSKRNVKRLLERGAIEVGQPLYPWMVAVHSSFLVACVAEVWLLERPFLPLLAWFSLGALVGAAALRWWVMATLGQRWSTRVIIVPGAAPISGGPFQRLRHPNYLAVIVEFIALPLVHTAWATAIVFSLLDAFVLRSRIRTEEAALAAHGSYHEVMGGRRRFVPGAE